MEASGGLGYARRVCLVDGSWWIVVDEGSFKLRDSMRNDGVKRLCSAGQMGMGSLPA